MNQVVILKKVNIDNLMAFFGPSLKCNSTLGFRLTSTLADYVASPVGGGFYKYHQVAITEFCKELQNIGTKELHVFIYQGSNLKSTLREFSTPIDIELHYLEDDDGLFYVTKMTMYDETKSLVIDFTCAAISLGYQYYDKPERQRFFGHINAHNQFAMTADQLNKIGSISNLNNTDSESTYFSIKSENGRLVAFDDSFSFVLAENYQNDLPEARINKSRLGLLDAVDYVVETSYIDDVEDPYHKIIFKSTRGTIQSTFALLNSVDSVNDDDINSSFEDFNLSIS